MKKILIFTFLTMMAVTLFSALFEIFLFKFAPAREERTVTLDNAIQTLQLVGADTALKLRGTPEEGHKFSIATEDKWGCGLHAVIQQEGETLTVRLEKISTWLRWWCDPDVTISMPDGLNLAIGLKNLIADLNGHFGGVAIRSKRSAISFRGSAERFQLDGDAAIVDLGFDKAMPSEALSLNVEKLVSRVKFEK